MTPKLPNILITRVLQITVKKNIVKNWKLVLLFFREMPITGKNIDISPKNVLLSSLYIIKYFLHDFKIGRNNQIRPCLHFPCLNVAE